jgi:hypothetical protein
MTDHEDLFDDVIGMSEEEAIANIEGRKYEVRVVVREDEHFVFTMEHCTDRVNLTIKDGIVRRATIG